MDARELRRLFVLANAFKEGDLLVGGTSDDRIRDEARQQLLSLRVRDIRQAVIVEDAVTAALQRSRDRSCDADLDPLTIRQLKDRLLAVHRNALPSEVIAAIAKVMTNDELSSIARSVFNPIGDHEVAIGGAGHLGSRIQPNSPGDDEEEILFSILEGLAYGCGDVIIGLNPAADELDTIVRLEQLLEQVVTRLDLPTRYCVLSDMVKQQRARDRARIDVGFQSLAGTSKAIVGMVGLDVDGLLDLARDFGGLYFETGQGSAVTNGAAENVDMVTLEARAYGVARYLQQQTRAWTIVNDVAGYIGPEVFRTGEQLERACLEDIVMAKLHGLTMGLDVCATFHMGIPPAELQTLTQRIAERAAPAYLMAVAGNADPMLGYLTTSFREHRRLRQATGRQIAAPMQRRLAALPETVEELYAVWAKQGGDYRPASLLVEEGRRRLAALAERGFDLGRGHGPGYSAPTPVQARLDAIYAHARQALYARIAPSVLREACPTYLAVRTRASDREDYLAHPAAGERLADRDVTTIAGLYPGRRPRIQIVVSDGLNADAINEHLRRLLPAIRKPLIDAGCHVGATDIAIENGRVRAGYHVGAILDPEALIHVIGERPGTGLNTVSAYLTYGRDERGASRWAPSLDHSATSAICGIHPHGKPPDIAAAEIVRTVRRMLEQKRSGVRLGGTI